MKKIVLHVCNNVKKEVEKSLEGSDFSDIEIKIFSSYCGNLPVKKEDLEISKKPEDQQINLAIGSICLNEVKKQNNKLSKVITIENCFHLFLNNRLADSYILEGAYLITPGWLINWRKYIEIWKFDQPTAREFFAESCKYLLLLDTGIYEDIDKYLEEFSKFVGVHSKLLPIGLDYFKMKLLRTISEQKQKIILQEEEQKNSVLKRKNADYAMAMDLMGTLAKSKNEIEVVKNILMTMNMLFAPKSLHYLTFKKNKPDELVSFAGSEVSGEDIFTTLSNLTNQYEWTMSGNGFCLLIRFNDETLGALYLGDLTYPQFKEHYLNLGLYLTKVCGLAMSNARSFEIAKEQQKQLLQNFDKLKDSENKLKVSSEHLKMLNKIIRHDLSNDFTVIKSAVKLFKKNKDEIMLDEISKRVTKSLIAISNYKEHESFIELNKKLKSIDILKLLEDIITYYPKIDIQIVGNCVVFADDGLNSVFTNLISNSIRHGNATKIEIRISSVGNVCKIIISDNGSGIPDIVKDKVFDEGFTHGKSGNTGIGLYIVKTMIEKYKGSLYIEDNKPKGVSFIIRLRKVSAE